jgi:hypothetical protein
MLFVVHVITTCAPFSRSVPMIIPASAKDTSKSNSGTKPCLRFAQDGYFVVLPCALLWERYTVSSPFFDSFDWISKIFLHMVVCYHILVSVLKCWNYGLLVWSCTMLVGIIVTATNHSSDHIGIDYCDFYSIWFLLVNTKLFDSFQWHIINWPNYISDWTFSDLLFTI